jgi:hypothetical protein
MVLPFKKWWMTGVIVPARWPGVFSQRYRFFALCFRSGSDAMDGL